MKKSFLLSLLTACSLSLVAQSSYDQVYSLFQANCTVGCHSGVAPSGQLNLGGTSAEVFQNLINVSPVNPAANAAGHKLVDPGYPERSFLFVKLSHDIDPVTHLTIPMGNAMPDGQPRLDYEEIELVRQWILYGAGDTNHYFDAQILSDYYNGPAMPRMAPLAPPAASEGYQMHYGPFFLNPLTEKEFLYKYNTKMPATKEVNRIDVVINDYAHHTALYKYFPGADSIFLPGLRPVISMFDAAGVFFNSAILGQWPNSQNLVLPEGTAFTWEANTVLDLNYHLPNYNNDSILAAEFYMNIYTQPVGTAQAEMIAGPVYYGPNTPLDLIIPAGTVDSVYTMEQRTDTSNTWYIWSMMAHTHQLGSEYNVWLRNPNGTKGDQIYNGDYNSDYTFNQGYYDWAHPPFRTFDPLLEVDLINGLIHEATFSNPGPNPVNFGLTTADEMYVTYIQYTTEPVTIGVKEENDIFNYFNAYPNPSTDVVNLSFNSENAATANLSLYDNLGRQVYAKTIQISQGKQKLQLSQQALGLTPGFYSLIVSTPEGTKTAKIIFE